MRRIRRRWKSLWSGATVLALLGQLVLPPAWAQGAAHLPPPGTPVLATAPFVPLMLTGINVDPDNPLRISVFLNTGDAGSSPDTLSDESARLVRYFLAALTIPEDDVWVNLSPYEGDRIMMPALQRTEMGEALLAQDYLLKQLTASLINPETETGAAFWRQVYAEAGRVMGTTQIPVDTFHKVWIVPQRAVVAEQGNTAHVLDSRLEVLLEEDYVAREQSIRAEKVPGGRDDGTATGTPDEAATAAEAQVISTRAAREVLLPAIEREVNEGATFAPLRQVYHALILATWYKLKLAEGLLGQSYADQNKTRGVEAADQAFAEAIYGQYLTALRRGVTSGVHETFDPLSGQVIPRKYFSGGFSTRRAGSPLKGLAKNLGAIILSSLLLVTDVPQATADVRAAVELHPVAEDSALVNPDAAEARRALQLSFDNLVLTHTPQGKIKEITVLPVGVDPETAASFKADLADIINAPPASVQQVLDALRANPSDVGAVIALVKKHSLNLAGTIGSYPELVDLLSPAVAAAWIAGETPEDAGRNMEELFKVREDWAAAVLQKLSKSGQTQHIRKIVYHIGFHDEQIDTESERERLNVMRESLTPLVDPKIFRSVLIKKGASKYDQILEKAEALQKLRAGDGPYKKQEEFNYSFQLARLFDEMDRTLQVGGRKLLVESGEIDHTALFTDYSGTAAWYFEFVLNRKDQFADRNHLLVMARYFTRHSLDKLAETVEWGSKQGVFNENDKQTLSEIFQEHGRRAYRRWQDGEPTAYAEAARYHDLLVQLGDGEGTSSTEYYEGLANEPATRGRPASGGAVVYKDTYVASVSWPGFDAEIEVTSYDPERTARELWQQIQRAIETQSQGVVRTEEAPAGPGTVRTASSGLTGMPVDRRSIARMLRALGMALTLNLPVPPLAAAQEPVAGGPTAVMEDVGNVERVLESEFSNLVVSYSPAGRIQKIEILPEGSEDLRAGNFQMQTPGPSKLQSGPRFVKRMQPVVQALRENPSDVAGVMSLVKKLGFPFIDALKISPELPSLLTPEVASAWFLEEGVFRWAHSARKLFEANPGLAMNVVANLNGQGIDSMKKFLENVFLEFEKGAPPKEREAFAHFVRAMVQVVDPAVSEYFREEGHPFIKNLLKEIVDAPENLRTNTLSHQLPDDEWYKSVLRVTALGLPGFTDEIEVISRVPDLTAAQAWDAMRGAVKEVSVQGEATPATDARRDGPGSGRASSDLSPPASSSSPDRLGGIRLDPSRRNFQIRRETSGTAASTTFPTLDPAALQGLVPEIVDIVFLK